MNEKELQKKIDKLYFEMNGVYDEKKMNVIHSLQVEKKGIKSRKDRFTKQIAPIQCEIFK